MSVVMPVAFLLLSFLILACGPGEEEHGSGNEAPATQTTGVAVTSATSTTGASQPTPLPTKSPATPTAIPDRDLLGTEWQLESVADRPVIKAPDGRIPVLILVKEENLAAGFGGVNNFNGTYVLDGNSLTFSRTMSNVRSGLPQLEEQETALFTALGATVSWGIDGNTLVLLGADGNLLAVFKAKEDSHSSP